MLRLIPHQNLSSSPAKLAMGGCCKILFTVVALLLAAGSSAGVLPEDRADSLYHVFDGGGVKVDGPAILVRKGDNKRFSVAAKYYVDNISSASVDVITQGSPYSEKRIETSITMDFLHADTAMTWQFSNSNESDYKANTFGFDISQSLFGDLTTVALGYSVGFDKISNNVDATIGEDARHQKFRLSLSQILSQRLILSLKYEAITDDGFLNSPYRSVRFLVTSDSTATQLENYPETRTSNSIAANLRYHLPYRAALGMGYRYYIDDWNIAAHTVDLNYTQPLGKRLLFDFDYRYYTQTNADFYSDLFPRIDAQNFLARDKELSTFSDHSIGFGVSYEFLSNPWTLIDRAALSLSYRYLYFTYDNFSDLTKGASIGQEPSLKFSANVYQIFLSLWY